MRVMDLMPGMVNQVGFQHGIVIAITPHPVHEGFTLVIWWLVEPKRYSFDALAPMMELPGTVQEFTKETLTENWYKAVRGEK